MGGGVKKKDPKLTQLRNENNKRGSCQLATHRSPSASRKPFAQAINQNHTPALEAALRETHLFPSVATACVIQLWEGMKSQE